MPVPSNTPGLTLGPGIIDVGMFSGDTDPAVVEALGSVQTTLAALGWVAPKQTASNRGFYGVFYDPDDENFYGGNPQDPENPHLLGAAGALTFKTIVVAGQDDVVADDTADTLTLVAGTNITLTTDAATDTITIAAAGGGGSASDSFATIAVSGQSSVVADSPTDTLTLVAGSNITITTNAGADSITIAATDTNTTYTAGDGLDLTIGAFSVDLAANKGLEIISTELAVKLGSNLSFGGSGEINATDTNTTYTAGNLLDLAGTQFDVDLTEATDYSGGTVQLLGHDAAGVLRWKSLADWFNLLGGYTSGNDQSIGHDASGSTAWQNDDVCS